MKIFILNRFVISIFLPLITGVAITNSHRFFNVTAQDDDVKLYQRLVTIKGKVTIKNHPELGETPGNGMNLLFQRDGCRSCLVLVKADIEGNYELTVGRAKYKLIVRNPSPPERDLLAANQSRVIETRTSTDSIIRFDVALMLPNDK